MMELEQGKIDWSMLDFVMPRAAEIRYQDAALDRDRPEWAREPEAFLGRHGPPADPQTFANFVGEILKRLPRNGTRCRSLE